MEPAYPVGSQVIVKPLEGEARKQVHAGQVITFMPNPGDPTLVTHRVVGVQANSDGSVSYTTRGDANGADDPDPVYDYQVRATAVYHVPYMGYVAGWISPQIRQYLVYGLVALLLGYAGYQVFKAVSERRGPGAQDDAELHSADPRAAHSGQDAAGPEGLPGGKAAGSREAAGASTWEGGNV